MAIQNGTTFYQFDPTEDIVTDRRDVSAGLWSGGSGNLLNVFLSPTQTASSGEYYVDVYNYNPVTSTTVTPEVQFSIAYGNVNGSGSLILNSQYPTEAIYSQYRNILLEPDDSYFTIGGVNKVHILAIAFKLDRIKQTLDPGNWQLSIVGSNRNVTLIDDSGQSAGSQFGHSGRIFNVVSGTIAGGIYSPTTTYGLVYPDAGFIILDPDVVSSSAGVNCNVTASNVSEKNHVALFSAISASMSAGNGFLARNVENVASSHYFVRAKSAAFNFSNNPTFVTGSQGDLYNQDMIKNPTVYITTVGLYDSANELLAVAKLSQPLKKTFTNEALIRVKLDF